MRRSMTIAMHALAHGSVLALAACGIPSPSMSSTTGAETGDDAGTSDDGDHGDTQTSHCEAEIAVLAPFVTHPEGGCSVVLRLHHETLALLGYQSTCAPYSDTRLDESQARALTHCCKSAGAPLDATTDQEPDDLDPWVLYAMPAMSDDLGGVAVVSNHVAELSFEGTIARGSDGEGGIVHPDTWYEPNALGSGCGTVPIPEGLRSYDLVEGGAIAEDRLGEVWSVVGSTALLFAMSVVGEPQRAAVLRYPRRVDAFDPSTAEYVVVIEGGIPRDAIPD
jgi:hypothetical protein